MERRQSARLLPKHIVPPSPLPRPRIEQLFRCLLSRFLGSSTRTNERKKKYLLMDWKRKKKSETARREISDLGDIQQRPSRYFHAALGAWLSTVVMLFSSAGPLLGALMILFDFPMASHNRLRRGILIFSHHEALSFHLASVSRRINVGAGEAADENLCHEVAEASSTQHCS